MSLTYDIIRSFLIQPLRDESIEDVKQQMRELNILVEDQISINNEMRNPIDVYDFLFDKITDIEITIERDNRLGLEINIDFVSERYFYGLKFHNKKTKYIDFSIQDRYAHFTWFNIDISFLLMFLLFEKIHPDISLYIKNYIFTYKSANGRYENFDLRLVFTEGGYFTTNKWKMSNTWEDVSQFYSGLLHSLSEVYSTGRRSFGVFDYRINLKANLCKDCLLIRDRITDLMNDNNEYIVTLQKFNT